MSEEENNKKAVVKKEKENSEDLDTPIPTELLDKIPPEVRNEVKHELQKFTAISSARYVGPMPHPFAGKINEEHVGKIIDYTEKDDQRGFSERKSIRNMTLIIFFGILVFIAGLTIFFTLQDKAEFIVPFMTGLLGAAGGFGGGYGIARLKK